VLNDAALVVRTPLLESRFDPTHGGRIVSLRDLRRGREWLVQGDSAHELAHYGSSFTTRHIYGWDEMMPTIDECVIEGRHLPDHGELWAIPWSVDGDGSEGGVRLSARSAALPVTLTREARAVGDAIVLQYTLTNSGAEPHAVLWAAHPQFSAEPDTILRWEAEVHTGRISSPRQSAGVQNWSRIVEVAAAIRPGEHLKAWIDGPGIPSGIALHDGEAGLSISWSGEAVQHVSVLWDHAQFSTRPTIAVEPATTRFESLREAVACGETPVLASGASLHWQLKLAVIDDTLRSPLL